MNPVNMVGELLKDRSRRCRKNYALTADQDECVSAADMSIAGDDPSAVRWCLVGAIQKVEAETARSAVRYGVGLAIGTNNLINKWDDASDEEQDAIVEKLLSYKEEE